MANNRTIKLNNYKKSLKSLLERYPEGYKVANRYKVIKALLHREHSNFMEGMDMDRLEVFLQDVIYLDRQVRYATEGHDTETKKILSQEKQKELGY